MFNTFVVVFVEPQNLAALQGANAKNRFFISKNIIQKNQIFQTGLNKYRGDL